METFWCWWASRYVYKTDRTCSGKRVYEDICGHTYLFTPEEEARLERR